MLVATKPPGVLIVLYYIETRRQKRFPSFTFLFESYLCYSRYKKVFLFLFFDQAKQLASLRSSKAFDVLMHDALIFIRNIAFSFY